MAFAYICNSAGRGARETHMSIQSIDQEIAHLETVFGRISTPECPTLASFPLSYWQQRLNDLDRSSMMPAQRARVARLEATLRSLGDRRAQAPIGHKPPRSPPSAKP